MRSKEKQEGRRLGEKKKPVVKVNPGARRVHSNLAILEQMIRQNVRPARSDLAAILDGDLRVGSRSVPDAVRIAIQKELRGESRQGQKQVTIEWYLTRNFNPFFDYRKLKWDHEKRGEKVRVQDITNAVVKANPIDGEQLKRLRIKRRKSERSSFSKKPVESST